jgi:hypothetical protein
MITPKTTATAIVAAAAAAAIASAAVPAAAEHLVAYTTDPIKVVSYSIAPISAAPVPVWGGTYMNVASVGQVTISFVDLGGVAAKSVRFTVRSGNATETITDKGTFSPGTSITHDFSLAPEFGNASTVEVAHVTFADGTTWDRQ